MNICVIGTGYVGLVQAAAMAEVGNTVVGMDNDPKKLEVIAKGGIPIYEPGLEEVVQKNIQQGRLKFTDNLAQGIKDAQVIFIAVGTPPKEDGSADLQYVKAVASQIAKELDHYAVVVNKSTVPVGTVQEIKKIIKDTYKGKFDVASNPEFLREGTALDDFLKPDRVVVGLEAKASKAKKIMEELYLPLNAPILFTDIASAELIKYASNSFLAVEISYINMLSRYAQKVGANIKDIAQGMRLDQRIGKKAFLDAGLGYGGSCFPKDVQALIRLLWASESEACLLTGAEDINHTQREWVVDKVRRSVGGKLKDKKVAVWGISFKPNTDDTRESPAVAVINFLIKEGARVEAYDPVLSEMGTDEIPPKALAKTAMKAVKDADALLVATDWDEFKTVDWTQVKKLLKHPNIIDARNIYDKKTLEKKGFQYEGIGV